jgi:hypothetical protein
MGSPSRIVTALAEHSDRCGHDLCGSSSWRSRTRSVSTYKRRLFNESNVALCIAGLPITRRPIASAPNATPPTATAPTATAPMAPTPALNFSTRRTEFPFIEMPGDSTLLSFLCGVACPSNGTNRLAPLRFLAPGRDHWDDSETPKPAVTPLSGAGTPHLPRSWKTVS